MKKDLSKLQNCKIYKISADSNCYFLDFDSKIVIDTGRMENKDMVSDFIESKIGLDKIEKVIFTHLHYDHTANFDLFPYAKFYASKQEIGDYNKDPLGAILDPGLVKVFNIKLNPIEDFDGIKILNTPGHTRGSISLWYESKKILFSGDTLFFNDLYGRTDLPTSVPSKMQESLAKLKKLDFEILCPGHDY